MPEVTFPMSQRCYKENITKKHRQGELHPEIFGKTAMNYLIYNTRNYVSISLTTFNKVVICQRNVSSTDLECREVG